MEIGVGIVFALGGLLFCLLAGLIASGSVRRLRDSKVAQGKVVGYDEFARSGRTCYRPRVEFTARDGRKIQFAASTASSRQPYRIGAKVQVLVDPANPERSDLRAFSTLWLPTVLLGFFGLTFLGLGISLAFGWLT